MYTSKNLIKRDVFLLLSPEEVYAFEYLLLAKEVGDQGIAFGFFVKFQRLQIDNNGVREHVDSTTSLWYGGWS